MIRSPADNRVAGRAARHRGSAPAFSLVELLTVIFIISLLIGILIPSLGAARNAAKKSKTSSDVRAIGTALELFKNDNERDFPHTNGYPPSFAHPPISGAYSFDAYLGQFPFLEEASESSPPVVYGTHWLPAMLMGVDNLGYVKKSSVPSRLRSMPWRWYSADPNEDGSGPLPRTPFYIEPEGVKTAITQNLRGRRPSNESRFFPDWDDMKQLPVMVDAFDQPILYYAANRHGRTSNIVEVVRDLDNEYTGGVQQEGPPYYFHQDNMGFTGLGQEEGGMGWDFGGGGHAIAKPGHDLSPGELADPELSGHRETFVYFILDPQIRRRLVAVSDPDDPGTVNANTPLKPVNPETFLLISAGTDGKYGTSDDVTNFPLAAE